MRYAIRHPEGDTIGIVEGEAALHDLARSIATTTVAGTMAIDRDEVPWGFLILDDGRPDGWTTEIPTDRSGEHCPRRRDHAIAPDDVAGNPHSSAPPTDPSTPPLADSGPQLLGMPGWPL